MSITEALTQFIPGFINAIFTFFMTVLVTVIQVITWPLNQIITATFPDLATQITNVSTNLGSMLSYIPYILSFLPPGILALLLFIMGVELVLMSVFQSSYLVAKVWKILQKIKFW